MASAEVAVRQPWDKLPGESQTAFADFVAYRDMPPPRTVEKVVPLRQKSASTLNKHRQKYHWTERAHAYDLYVDQQRQQARLDAIKEADERTLQLGRLMQGEAIRGIVGQRAGVGPDGQIVEEREGIKPEAAVDVARYAETGTKLIRLTLGLPTDLAKMLDAVSMRQFQEVVLAIVEDALSRMPEEEHEGHIRAVREIGMRATGASA